MNVTSHIVNTKSIGHVHISAKDWMSRFSHNVRMEKTLDLNHLRAWREFRKMTQSELAEKCGTTDSVISMLESGDRGLSQKWLARLAPALKTRPGHILDIDPADIDTDIIDLWANIAERDRAKARQVLLAFKKDGTFD